MAAVQSASDFEGFVKEFLDVYNTPPHNIKQFYANKMIWVEIPGGRSGGQDEYFAASDGVRDVMERVEITETIGTHFSSDTGIFECKWRATRRNGAGDIHAILVWVWQFDETGKITMQRDYFMPAT
ncbi:hypothetical protein [Arthrobacter sp. P2b]|uniref:hypothetical protein n=1 Tax=Arthrobacter sp. P2b TaxID=1938741 RepID=UPI0009A87D84|nr:hypothetical protein [Arthrobacter sp. P2b]SLK10612.1 hypothetical protein SAMN06272721_11382 [Arthrobacter sp. P2b]